MYLYLESERTEISRSHEEMGLKTFDTHRTEKSSTITYLMSLCKWLAEQGLGEIPKRNFIQGYKGQELVESNDQRKRIVLQKIDLPFWHILLVEKKKVLRAQIHAYTLVFPL